MSNYTYLDQVLNEQFLGNTFLSNFLFERLLNRDEKIEQFPNHIFITGLARAGTTALLNYFYQSDDLGSFLYKHMPFILSPRIAKYASKLVQKKLGEQERLHNDGIMISSESPECLDEVFWIKAADEYYAQSITDSDSSYSQVNLRGYSYLLSRFAEIQLKSRLVVKNNNHHIRLDALSEFFVSSHFIVVYRDPVNHALSLLDAHRRFLKIQESDPYVLKYMNLIGHREFGSGAHKFIYKAITPHSDIKYAKDNINYWLVQWLNCYKYILSLKKRDNIILVGYESMCSNQSYLNLLSSHLKVAGVKHNNLKLRRNMHGDGLNIDSNLRDDAYAVYNKLLSSDFIFQVN